MKTRSHVSSSFECQQQVCRQLRLAQLGSSFTRLSALRMLQVAGVLKLWFSCLPEPVVPPEMYDAFLRTQRHRGPEARVAGIHAVLRQCEHRVLQVLYPLMEVCVLAHARVGSPWGADGRRKSAD